MGGNGLEISWATEAETGKGMERRRGRSEVVSVARGIADSQMVKVRGLPLLSVIAITTLASTNVLPYDQLNEILSIKISVEGRMSITRNNTNFLFQNQIIQPERFYNPLTYHLRNL